MESDHDITAEKICNKLGRKRIAEAMGVRLTSVSNAVVEGRFPARWFHIMDELCSSMNIPCPRSLFTFVGVESEEFVADPAPQDSEFSHVKPQDTDAA